MKTSLALLAVALLGGCATGIKAQVAGANIEIAKQRAQAAAQPILNASIPIQGCTVPDGQDYKAACVMTIVVHAPQGPNSGQVTMPDDPWARVAERAIGGLVTAGGIFLGGQAAANIVESAATGIIGALKVQPAPTVVMPADPVIVPPAEPIIVPPAEPVIVNPVIVEPVVVQLPPAEIVQVPVAP